MIKVESIDFIDRGWRTQLARVVVLIEEALRVMKYTSGQSVDVANIEVEVEGVSCILRQLLVQIPHPVFTNEGWIRGTES